MTFVPYVKQKRVEIRINAVGIPLIPKLPRAFAPYVNQKRVNLKLQINAVGIPLIPKLPRAFAPYVNKKRIDTLVIAVGILLYRNCRGL